MRLILRPPKLPRPARLGCCPIRPRPREPRSDSPRRSCCCVRLCEYVSTHTHLPPAQYSVLAGAPPASRGARDGAKGCGLRPGVGVMRTSVGETHAHAWRALQLPDVRDHWLCGCTARAARAVFSLFSLSPPSATRKQLGVAADTGSGSTTTSHARESPGRSAGGPAGTHPNANAIPKVDTRPPPALETWNPSCPRKVL